MPPHYDKISRCFSNPLRLNAFATCREVFIGPAALTSSMATMDRGRQTGSNPFKSLRTESLFAPGIFMKPLLSGESLAAVSGVVHRGDAIDRELRVGIQRNTRQTFVNGKRETAARYLGQLHAVWFTSDELEVVRGGPDARRSFLDRGVISLHSPYAQTLNDYTRVIKQRSGSWISLQRARSVWMNSGNWLNPGTNS
mgnify:CR=1 FL=1